MVIPSGGLPLNPISNRMIMVLGHTKRVHTYLYLLRLCRSEPGEGMEGMGASGRRYEGMEGMGASVRQRPGVDHHLTLSLKGRANASSRD